MNNRLKSYVRSLLPRSVRRQRIWAGPLRGHSIVTSWHDYPAAILGRTEHPLLEWFAAKVRPGETWIDVGGHYGYTAVALSRLVGRSGRIFVFEPTISTAGYLSQTRLVNDLPQLTVLPFALANGADGLELRGLPVVRGMVDSTIHSSDWTETVIMTRFDWLWPQIFGDERQIHGIKIDVQGMEGEVLMGMLNSLRVCRPKLVVEFHRGVDRDMLLRTIQMAGYSKRATPIEPLPGETAPLFVDDRSYAFHVAATA